jgi:hypothetical protein
MGKVASSSVYTSLKMTTNLDVYHIHRLNPQNIKLVKEEHLKRGDSPPLDHEGLYLYKNLIRHGKKSVKIITLIREPISRNISAFFQNLESFERIKNAHNVVSIEQLVADFIRLYNHDVPLTWFNVELFKTTGVDVYQHSFPYEKGYQVIDAPPYCLLIIRHDLEDKLKEKCIAEFIGVESFCLSRENEASLKQYADTYQEFLDSIKLPDEYIKWMLSSKYAKHFYSDEERCAIYKIWTVGP